MAESDLESGAEPDPPATVPPGAMSALLRELAAAPATDVPPAWNRALVPGSVVGRFELLRELGRGGFGVVYEARDHTLGRLVAFKAVRPGSRVADHQRGQWLWKEAEAAAQLSHPNIVTLFDVGTSEHGPYLVFELLHGETLEDRLRHGPVPWRTALSIGVHVARALAHAHAAGVVHRDLKPANVFLTENDGVKVLDFGLAHVFGTSALGGGGTPAFMAPEQWRGRAEDARTDVFGLGAILYAALTGRAPYEVRQSRSTVLDSASPPPVQVHGCPRALCDVVQRSLAHDPDDRPRDGGDFLDELLAVEKSLAPPQPRVRWVAVAAAALLLAALAGLLLAQRSKLGATVAVPYVVAVADVVNETRQPELDSLSGLLITSLEQSHRFRVLTRTRLRDALEEMGRGSAADRVDEASAKAVATRVRANAVLVPAVRRFGAIYSIEVKGLDPASDSYLFAIEERATDWQSIPAAIDRVSNRTRSALRESAKDIEVNRIDVARSVTQDLEAYRHYFLGVACDGGPECAEHFRRALAIDPTFALAQYQLAYRAEFGSAPLAEQREAFQKALQYIDRFPARERMFMLAWQAHLEGDDDGAANVYERLVNAYPDDKNAQYLAGDLQFHRDRPELAIPYFMRAHELDPADRYPVMHLIEALASTGRIEEMLTVARRRADTFPGPGPQLLLATALARAGDRGALDVARQAMQRAPPATDLEYAFHTLLLFSGAYPESEARARGHFASLHSQDGHSPEGHFLWPHLALAEALAYQGRRREGVLVLSGGRSSVTAANERLYHVARIQYLAADGARAAIEADVAWLRDNDPHFAEQATILAYLGRFEDAADAARRLTPRSPDERAYFAVLRWRRGDPSGAADDLAPLASRRMVRGLVAAYEPWFEAEALAEAGRDAEAIAALQRFQATYMNPAVYRSWAYPRSLLLLAKALARRGERDEALSVIAKLLEAWRNGDPESPLLRETRALQRQLTGSGKAAPPPGFARPSAGQPPP